jgi:hypothetical protein
VKPTVRSKTYRSCEQMVRNHLAKTVPQEEWKDKKLDNVPGLSSVKLKNLSVAGLEQFFNAKIAAGTSPSLVRYLRTVLRVALNEALAGSSVHGGVGDWAAAWRSPRSSVARDRS